MRRVLWLGDGESAADIDRLERTAEVKITTASRGSLKSELREGHRYKAVFLKLPAADWALDAVLREAYDTDSFLSVLIQDEQRTFDESLVRPPLSGVSRITEPASIEYLAGVVRNAVDEAARFRVPANEPWRDLLVGESRAMRHLRALIRLVGPRQATVLMTGETGTGKEMVARAIHMASRRAAGKLVAVNCAALPDNLFEAELFGHAKGAFTGAAACRIGSFEQANHGTIFLDEIGEIPVEIQAKLLRVLQQRELQRLGSSETIHLDIRVLAASNIDLVGAVEQKRFREDLFYRLNVVPVHVPALRERLEDIPLLVDHFLQKICRREALPLKRFSQDALDALCSYTWPGNVRQLEHAVEQAISLSGERSVLYVGDMPFLPGLRSGTRDPQADALVPESGVNYEQMMARLERTFLQEALRKCGGNKARTADMLGLKRTTLLYKVKALECTA